MLRATLPRPDGLVLSIGISALIFLSHFNLR